VETALKGVPVSVSLTQNGFKALARALRVPPQLVILDFDMPEMNGVETLSHLREIPGAAQAPVLVVSGNLGAVEQWRFSVLGVRDFLRKPVNLWDLVDAIARLARRARAASAPTQTPVEDGLPPPRPSHRLPVEVFLGFLAAAWADGRLDDVERDAVIEAAASEGLGDEEMERVRQGTLARVELDDLDFSTLNRTDRLYAYAVAHWISNLDDKITAREEATLRVLRVTLGVSDRERAAMEAALRELTQNPEHRAPQRFDFQGLRRVIAAHVASAS
jgi:CheY-like chemotaxis protein